MKTTWSFVLALALLPLLIGCVTSPVANPAHTDSPSEMAIEAVAEAPAAEAPAAEAPVPEPRDSLADRWGVEIEGLRRTSSGYMLDFRFRVLDTAKAAPLFVRATKPYLLDPVSGAQFQVPNPPKTGPLRTSNPPKEGVVYWMFFANPGRYLEPGASVTVVIGDFRAENLIVE